MRKRRILIIALMILTFVLGSMQSGDVVASEVARSLPNENQRGLRLITGLTLNESEDQLAWTPVLGSLATGFTMVLDPANAFEYLDVDSVTPAPADGDYGFYLDPVRVPANFWSYWAAQGVVSGASGWQADMWEIINGRLPMFYLRVNSSGFSLIDGLAYKMAVDPSLENTPVRVNGDYPLHTYNFEGTVGSDTLVVGITFTHDVTPSLRIGTTEVTPIVIDGCGYVDVIIHLENVANLFAVDLNLSFDPALVEVMDLGAEAGVNLAPSAPWNDPAKAYTVSNVADNTAGTISYISSLYNSESPISGDLDVAVIRLRAKGVGASAISITAMELSDRDGYLVGLPLTTAIPYPVTTQFTATGGLDLGISRLDAANVQLDWQKQALDTGAVYKLYRSTLPYFNLLDAGVVQITSPFTTTGTTMTYTDPVLGDVVNNYFYSLQVTCENGFVSPASWQVGKFEYDMYKLFDDTDFTWVGLVLETEVPLLNASDLAAHIIANSNSSVTVKTISEWNASAQNISLYSTTNPTTTFNFPLSVGSAYRIEIDLAELSGAAIWAQVGKLPQIEAFTYTLYELFDDTDFTWVLVPLNGVNITSASLLADDIILRSSPTVAVKTIVEWSAISQNNTLYRRSTGTINFPTRFGYPYRLEIDVSSGLTAIWP